MAQTRQFKVTLVIDELDGDGKHVKTNSAVMIAPEFEGETDTHRGMSCAMRGYAAHLATEAFDMWKSDEK